MRIALMSMEFVIRSCIANGTATQDSATVPCQKDSQFVSQTAVVLCTGIARQLDLSAQPLAGAARLAHYSVREMTHG